MLAIGTALRSGSPPPLSGSAACAWDAADHRLWRAALDQRARDALD
jgi:hypothetical protein